MLNSKIAMLIAAVTLASPATFACPGVGDTILQVIGVDPGCAADKVNAEIIKPNVPAWNDMDRTLTEAGRAIPGQLARPFVSPPAAFQAAPNWPHDATGPFARSANRPSLASDVCSDGKVVSKLPSPAPVGLACIMIDGGLGRIVPR
jgi:hypothetical protein